MYIPSQPGYASVGDLDIPGNTITVEAMFVRTMPYTHILYAGDLVSKHSEWRDVNYLLRPSTAEITTTTGYYITPDVCQIDLNRVYHVAMVYDGTSLKFYRNGFLLSEIAATGNLVQNNWQTRIGFYEAAVYPENLLGYVNEVRIWNVARTQQQIRDNMSSSLSNPTTQPGLLAYYQFDNLLNKQGNPAWNGVLGGSATIGHSLPNCQFIPDNCPQSLPDTIVVNSYTEVNSFESCTNRLDVGDASEFNVGDTVLLIQMKGAIVDSSNTNSFGTVSDYRNAGNYEFNYVKSITGNQIELLNAPGRNFDYQGGSVQLIRVPFYEEWNTYSVLSCLPWDGRKGGVLAVNVRNQLILNEDIDVSGRGFRGGKDPFTAPSSEHCYENQFYYPPNPDLASEKGESFAELSAARSYGKGALATGGGGGNSHNSGGGGGSNRGVGGFGGYNYELAPCNTNVPFDNRGFGGRPVNYAGLSNRIFMGGGGGAGQSNNLGFQATGGNGGGIVIISAGSMQALGHSIKADGANGIACQGSIPYCHEGMGGGGGGGVVLLNVAGLTDALTVSAAGGKGGDMISTGLGRLGPGGGGGGGVIALSSATVPASLTSRLTGGANGVNVGYNNDPWGATAGDQGSVLTNVSLPVSQHAFAPNIDSVRIQTQQTGCSDFSFQGLTYVKASPIVVWEWSLGDGTTAGVANIQHSYQQTGLFTVKLVATDAAGCKDSITTQVLVTSLDINFNYRQSACDPFTVEFEGSGTAIDAYWDFGDGTIITGETTPAHLFSPGVYTVKYASGTGNCNDTIRKVITIDLALADIILTPDTTICIGSVKQLRGLPSSDFCWSPTTNLTGANSYNPVTSTTSDITYYYTARINGANLLTNGDFEQGNQGFSSTYLFNDQSGLSAATYNVGNNPAVWNPSFSACDDHSGGTGNMLMANGSAGSGATVWSQTITVDPNTVYEFRGFFQSLSSMNASGIRLLINGELLTVSLPPDNQSCVWREFVQIWNSGVSTSANIELQSNLNLAIGNDFAIDDLFFSTLRYQRDSVRITVETPNVTASLDSTICSGTNAQLAASGAATYIWSPAVYLNDPTLPNPIANPLQTTEFVVTGTSNNGCVARDTVQISLFDLPTVTISNDTSICRQSSVELNISGGQTYQWSPVATLSNPNVANPIASPVTDTKYFVSITDQYNCQSLDSVLVKIRPPAQFTLASPAPVCLGDTLQLQAGGGDLYLWTPANSLSADNISSPLAWPTVSTEYSVTITESVCNESTTLSTNINVLPLPEVSASSSNDIDCTVDRSNLLATGAIEYSWTPVSTLDNPTVRNPVARPRTSTIYKVSGRGANGCFATDSVEVKVLNANEGDYLMPSAFTPNGDGLNDCYGVKYWGVVQNIEFSIYNRWGERVFFSKDPSACWDGTYKGVRQDAGVFVYMIRANTSCTENLFRKGTFVLIR